VTGINAGSSHSLVLANGTVYSFGLNSIGQLGNGTTIDASRTIVQASGLTSNIRGMYCTANYSSVLVGGNIFQFGSSAGGLSSSTPTYLRTDTSAVRLANMPPTIPIDLCGGSVSITNTINYSQTLQDVSMSYTGTFRDLLYNEVVTGSLSFLTPSIVPNGGSLQTWIFRPNDYIYETKTGTIQVTVNKATPVQDVSVNVVSISFGQTLSSSNLSGSFKNSSNNSSVSGSLSFDVGSSTVPPIGTTTYNWTFHPDASNNYNNHNGSIQVTVNKATPSLVSNILSSNVTGNATVFDNNGLEQIINLGELNTHAFIPMGTMLGDNRIYASFENPYDDSVVTGTISFTNRTFKPSLTDTTALWTFTPDDTNNYEVVYGSAPIKVGYILVTDTIFTFAENVDASFVSTTIYVDIVNFDNNSLILDSALDNSGTNLFSVLIADDTSTSYTPVTVTGTTTTNSYVNVPYSISVSNVNRTTPLLLSQVPSPYFNSPVPNSTTLAVMTYKVIDICNNGFITDLSNSPIPIEIDMGSSYANQTLFVSHIDASGNVTSTTAVQSNVSGVIQYSITKNPILTVTRRFVSIYLPYIFDLSANGIIFGESVQGISADYYLEEDVSKTTLSVTQLKAALKYKDDVVLDSINDLSLQQLPLPSQQSLTNIGSSLNRIVDVSSLKYWSGSTTYTNSTSNFSTAPLGEHYIQYVASVLFGHPQAQAPIKNDEQIVIDLSNGDLGGQFGGASGLSDVAVRRFIFEQLVNNSKNTIKPSGNRFDVSDNDPSSNTGYIDFPFEEGDEIVFRVRMYGGLDSDTATSFASGIGSLPIDLVNIFGNTSGVTNNTTSVSITPKVWAIKFVLGA
jgi:hypothetical protein